MDISQIRQRNLQLLEGQLRARLGKKGKPAPQKDAALALDMSPSYLSQLLGGKKLGDDVARKIEQVRKLPKGWMDVLQESVTRVGESAVVSYLPSQPAGRGDLILDLAGDLAEEIADSEQIERGSRRFLALHTTIVRRLERAFAANPTAAVASISPKVASRSPEETKNAERGPEEEAGQGPGAGRKGAAARKPGAGGAKRRP